MTSLTRNLTPYEETQLARYGGSRTQLLSSSIPVEYVTGKAEFRDMVFEVTPDVLIPRIETEELVSHSLSHIQSMAVGSRKIKVVEVGTGSGAIAITLSKSLAKMQIPHHITAVDISDKALNCAKKNAQLLGTNPSSLSFRQSNLLENLSPSFDYVIANLPYIPSSRLTNLDRSVRDHEPILALDGGFDGLSLIRRLIHQSETTLTTEGTIFLEVDDTHTREVWAEFEEKWSCSCFVDSFGKNRFVQLLKRTA